MSTSTNGPLGNANQLTEAILSQLQEIINEAVRVAFENQLQVFRSSIATTPPPVASPSDKGVEISAAERDAAKVARQESGVKLTIKDGQALIDFKTLALLLNVSTRTVCKMMSTNAIPKSITFGRIHRWIYEEILAWVYAGCPVRDHWERNKKRALQDFREWTTPVKK